MSGDKKTSRAGVCYSLGCGTHRRVFRRDDLVSDDLEHSELDRLLGANVTRIRTRKDISRPTLADKLGVSYRELQEYEAGVRRISASKLCEIAKALDTEISALFVGLELSRTRLATRDADLIEAPAEPDDSWGQNPAANDK